MRILYISPYPPARDGIGTYTNALIKELRGQGHDAAVIAPRAESAAHEDVIGVLGSQRGNLLALRDTVVAWRPDCIHLQFAVAAFGTRTPALISWLRLLRQTGVPLVITMHEITRDIGLLHGPGRALYRNLAKYCDRVIVHTRYARQECIDTTSVPGDYVHVIPHPTVPAPTEIVSSGTLRGRFGLGESTVLLAFGFIHVDKGLPDLVRALSILRRADPAALDNVKLVIAGSVRQRSGVFRLFELRDRIHLSRAMSAARRSGVAHSIVSTGYVPEAEIAGWFRAATAVVLPYRRTEQSGVAALANAFLVPVLASTVGGLDELYGGSAWTFPPCDPQAIAAVLSKFLAAPSGAATVESTGGLPAPGVGEVMKETIDVYRSASAGVAARQP